MNNVFHGAEHLSMDDSPFEILREQVAQSWGGLDD